MKATYCDMTTGEHRETTGEVLVTVIQTKPFSTSQQLFFLSYYQ